uniref:Uncharacterized protein n=1 Tax=Anguilla anguilla TaxID=7936 RepID=A0A0E9UQ52_ANGAN
MTPVFSIIICAFRTNLYKGKGFIQHMFANTNTLEKWTAVCNKLNKL